MNDFVNSLEDDKLYKILFIYRIPVDDYEEMDDTFIEYSYLSGPKAFILSKKNRGLTC